MQGYNTYNHNFNDILHWNLYQSYVSEMHAYQLKKFRLKFESQKYERRLQSYVPNQGRF